ncbi:ABC transporter related protein [Cyanobacterium stanieri PCC 7202]|uniref:ABC transporter related protein n=1 Tax=Cyanobacterium stanieri (strain ATCC 29140 / PCC 7202) TaxID=292563 RepID=K9YHT6_CYASC|nr:ABC transporter related protein [Cyanobacterium stanieri PCC 7202]
MDNKDSSLDNCLIKLENIYKIYGSGNTEVVALSAVNLIIESGEYCSIMGTSGSGKSTMMNILGCLDRPTRGEYYLNGDNVASLSSRQLAVIRNQKIGFVFQQFHLLPQLSALDNVILPMKYAGVTTEQQRARAVEALTKVGLENRLYNRPNQLSGGQQQRVAIARAIVNKPLILLADEPTGALDSETTKEVMKIFADLNQEGMTIILVTHEHEVAQLTHRIIQFSDGKIIQNNQRTLSLNHKPL